MHWARVLHRSSTLVPRLPHVARHVGASAENQLAQSGCLDLAQGMRRRGGQRRKERKEEGERCVGGKAVKSGCASVRLDPSRITPQTVFEVHPSGCQVAFKRYAREGPERPATRRPAYVSPGRTANHTIGGAILGPVAGNPHPCPPFLHCPFTWSDPNPAFAVAHHHSLLDTSLSRTACRGAAPTLADSLSVRLSRPSILPVSRQALHPKQSSDVSWTRNEQKSMTRCFVFPNVTPSLFSFEQLIWSSPTTIVFAMKQ